MARFYGAVGYVEEVETAPDVTTNKPVEYMYKGDLLKNYNRPDNGLDINDNIVINNQISFIADPYASRHMHAIRYVKWRGTAWKVTSVDATNLPRLVLSLGGVYNGETAE